VSPVLVLVVDDHESFRRAAASVVEAAAGFVVAGAVATGEESLAAAELLKPDLILMDINLPGMDGLEATRRLRASARPPAVVLLSTYDESELGAQARECGAIAYIAKSAFGTERLAAVWALAQA
jgi:DNA-binding NarL/FixJ family response regulator